MTKLRCSEFAEHVLSTPLWPRQKELLNELFEDNISHAIWAMGRRSGKSFCASVAAVYMAFCQDQYLRKCIRKNEKFHIVTVANDLDQAKIVLNDIRELILNSPLRQEILRDVDLEIEISNGCVFRAMPASARASRGKAVAAVIMDEVAFSMEGNTNRGAEALYTALSPSTAQFGKYGKIIELSSPWLTSGSFFSHFQQAKSGEFPGMRALQLPTWEVNPNLPFECDFLQNALKKDEESFHVEFGAQFRGNQSCLLASEIVDAAVNKERSVLLPKRELIGTYVLSLDPARGGVGRDDYTACIVHYEGETLIVDKFHTFPVDFEINGKKEVNIRAVEEWIREHHKIYTFESIVLDQYNSSATIQSLSADYPIEELTWSVSSKMKAFSKMKELFNSGLIELYNHEKAVKQLKNLGVVYKASGQWSITGGKESGVDDHAFALAAAILQASKEDDINWIASLVR
jgi:hypothetical protein